MEKKFEAYAIFAGGGVKGAAFAGCLKAAEQFGIEFLGYAGASAGSIVATLAAVGYSADEINRIMKETQYTEFLDDMSDKLKQLMTDVAGLQFNLWSYVSLPGVYFRNRHALRIIGEKFGLSEAQGLRSFLTEKLADQLSALTAPPEVHFADFRKAEKPLLKIMVSDITQRKPFVYSSGDPEAENVSVIDVVRASASYPFVFRPVRVNDKENLFVDGGLSCNLPFFVFEEERKKNNKPVIAFNLVSQSSKRDSYALSHFCGDMLSTALDSSEVLLHQFLQGIYVINVEIPAYINTLDFDLDDTKKEALYHAGYHKATTFFHKFMKEWTQVHSAVEKLQALYAPLHIVKPVLESAAKEFEGRLNCRDVRVHITLPTGHETRIIAYQYGMDADKDEAIEIPLESGCGGTAWKQQAPAFADLQHAKKNPQAWGLSEKQAETIRDDRRAILCVPIFGLNRSVQKINDLTPIGVLTIDSSTPLEETGWLEEQPRREAVFAAQKWADIISYILKGSL